MRIFITGGTGAIGRILVPRLVASGHDVSLLARPPRVPEVERWGAVPVVADPLDRGALTAAVQSARPDVVVHQLTALSAGVTNFRKFDKAFALTNRFRTEVTATLLAAARLVGSRRFIAQSFCGWPFARTGGPVKTEQDPLDPDPPAAFRGILAAIRQLEDAVRKAEGIEALALRYGLFYGPGTDISRDGRIIEAVRKRRLPIIGDGGGIWSFLHIADAAGATEAAITRGDPGIYNVVDDEPAPVANWLPFLAQTLGARPPRRVPVWLARLLVGEGGVSMMTQVRGGSNAKARRELEWEPTFPTWRRGFVEGTG